MSPKPLESSDRISALDGLRAFAIAAVVIHHTNGSRIENWALGNIGVAVFFAISGFFAYYVLSKDEMKLGDINYNLFLFRRILRIWPAYFLVIGIAFWWANPEQRANATILSLLTFTLNWEMVRFGPETLQALTPLWSIAVEMQFYLVAPLLYKVIESRHRFSFLIGSIAVINVLRVCVVSFGAPLPASGGIYYATFSYVDTFLAGMFVAHAYVYGFRPTFYSQVILFWIGAALLIIVTRFWFKLAASPHAILPTLPYALLPIATGLLLIALLPNNRTPLSQLLSFEPVRFIGEKLSYSIYLFHLVVMFNIVGTEGAKQASLAYNISILGTCFAIAFASWYFWESYFLRLKDKITEKEVSFPWPSIAVWSAFIFGVFQLLGR